MSRYLPLLLLSIVLVSTSTGIAGGKSFMDVDRAVLNTTGLKPGQQGVAAVVLTVKPGFHAQSHAPLNPDFHPTLASLDPNPALVLYEPIYPPGKIEKIAALDDKALSIYTGTITIYFPFQVKSDAQPGDLKLTGLYKYQACSDTSCFADITNSFTIETKIVAPGVAVGPANVDVFKNLDEKLITKSPISQPAIPPILKVEVQPALASSTVLPATADVNRPFLLESVYTRSQLSSVFDHAARGDTPGKMAGQDWSVSYAFGVAFLVGLIFNIMPCVLPVLPLKAIGFYEVGQHKRSRSFLFGLVFSLGIIAVFAILAVPIIVLKRISWGSLFSEWWFIWPMVLILVAMAAGLFGLFTFRLPVGAYSFEPRHDTFSGNFLLGGFTAILATPCTAPLLPPLLVWAATQPTLGVPAMIMVGVGMSSPYLILSALPELARKFPRTGPWSELFKQMMGFMLLAAAAYFAAGQLTHSVNYWWAVAAVVFLAAIFLIVRTYQLAPRRIPITVSSILAIAMVVASLAWTIRVTGFGQPQVAESFQPYSPELFDSARAQHKIVLVKFTASWCLTCQLIEGTVFHDPATWDQIRADGVVALKADFSNPNPAAQALLDHLSASGGIPLTAVYPPITQAAFSKPSDTPVVR